MTTKRKLRERIERLERDVSDLRARPQTFIITLPPPAAAPYFVPYFHLPLQVTVGPQYVPPVITWNGCADTQLLSTTTTTV